MLFSRVAHVLPKTEEGGKMAVKKLTKASIDALIRSHSGPRKEYWDTEIKGFGLRVTERKAVYIFGYRPGGGRGASQKKITFGSVGEFTPSEARERARRIAAEVASGGDPAAAIADRRAAPTVAELMDRYLSDHAEAHKKASSLKADRIHIRNAILPALGQRKVADIGPADIEKLHKSKRETPIAANRVLALLSKAFNLAERWNYRERYSNPCIDVKKFKENKRERMMQPDEIGRFAHALGLAERGQLPNARGGLRSISPYAVWAIRLIYFTGARKDEILGLRWDHVNLERAQLELPDSKTGAKIVLLNPAALEVLGQIERVDGNPHVIVGAKPGAHMVNIKDAWAAICEAGNLIDLRIHDLRHNFGAHAVSNGVSTPMLGSLLGHKQLSTTQRYSHFQNDPARAANELIGQKLAEALKAESSEAKKVVKFPGK